MRWSVPLMIVLLALVGLASRAGETTLVPSSVSGVGVLVWQIFESMGLLVALAGIALLVAVGPSIRRRRKPDEDDKHKVHWALRVALLVLYIALMGGIVTALKMAGGAPGFEPLSAVTPASPPLDGAAVDSSAQAGPSFPVVFAFVVLLTTAAAAAWWWRQRTPNRPSALPTDPLPAAIDDGLAALERESDPRRAVILAYHAMERALARCGFDRIAAEAPVEYMLRVLSYVPDCSDPVHDLTLLFEEAKYSRHEIGPPHRQSAVQALQTIRASLQASA